MAQTDIQQAPSLYFPGLAGFYRSIEPYGYPLIRFAAGAILIPHGWAKFAGAAPFIAEKILAPMGFPAPLAWAYFLACLETIGGILLALGLFTRLLAALFIVEFLFILFGHHIHFGYAFSSPGGGYEYPLLLLVVYIGIFMRGSERCAIDRMIGKEF
jgi:putative oxidoreductase